MKYKVVVYKVITQDDFEKGLIGQSQDEGQVFSFQSDDLNFVKNRLENHTNIKIVESEPYDDRLDCSVLETNDGFKANDQQIQLWKNGKLNLFLADYSIYMEKIQSVNASELLK